ncbi:Pycsar system effector family protein [Streptomyces sp. NPDC059985]|uniref:Pycsar system effector family protein n=1 Tax=Streptomyces sp. NPDC059985 TaxID=3347025 RepID=UPI0036CE2F94
MTTTEEDSPGPTAQAAAQLLADLRVEIARADTKASLLVGALGMTVGGLSTQLAGHRWGPGSLSAAGQTLWWFGAGALALSLAALLVSVVPRSLRSTWQAGTPLSYFGNIRSADQQGRLAEALAHTGRDPGAALIAALAANSRIAARKHQWIRAGLLAYGSGVVLLPVALLAG